MSRFPTLAEYIAAGLIKECPHCHCVWWPSETTHRCAGMVEAELAEAVRLLQGSRRFMSVAYCEGLTLAETIDAFLAKHKETGK